MLCKVGTVDKRELKRHPSCLPIRDVTQEFSGVRKCTRCRLQASSYYDQAPHTHNLPRTIRIEKESFISSCPSKHSSSWPYLGTPSTCSCVACLLIKFQSVFQTHQKFTISNQRYPWIVRTLLPASFLDLCRHADSHKSVVWLELLHRLW